MAAYECSDCGDVLELGDTLVLETSASRMRVRLSPSPPMNFAETWLSWTKALHC